MFWLLRKKIIFFCAGFTLYLSGMNVQQVVKVTQPAQHTFCIFFSGSHVNIIELPDNTKIGTSLTSQGVKILNQQQADELTLVAKTWLKYNHQN